MPKRQDPNFDWNWLKNKLKELIKVKQQMETSIHADVFYPAHKWTPLKLIVLMTYVGSVYSKIIPNTGIFSNWYYIDLCAGAGLNRVAETGDLIPGSAMIAKMFARTNFTKYILCEKRKDRREALESVMSQLMNSDEFKIYEDCNDAIGEIRKTYLNERRIHFLAFVDPEGYSEVKWLTMQTLLERQGDLIEVFMTSDVNRNAGMIQQAMIDYLGTEDYLNRGGTEILEMRKQSIAQIGTDFVKRSIVKDISVYGGKDVGDYHYHLIFAVRPTRAGSPWQRAWDNLKMRVESHTGDTVRSALEVLSGKRFEIEDFFTDTKE